MRGSGGPGRGAGSRDPDSTHIRDGISAGGAEKPYPPVTHVDPAQTSDPRNLRGIREDPVKDEAGKMRWVAGETEGRLYDRRATRIPVPKLGVLASRAVMTERRWSAISGISPSSTWRSSALTVTARKGEVTRTVAIRRWNRSRAISPTTSPGPILPTTSSFTVAFGRALLDHEHLSRGSTLLEEHLALLELHLADMMGDRRQVLEVELVEERQPAQAFDVDGHAGILLLARNVPWPGIAEPAAFHQDVPPLHHDLGESLHCASLVTRVVHVHVMRFRRDRALVLRIEDHDVGVEPRRD